MLTERSSHSVCFQDRKIFIIGGFAGAEGLVTRDCEVFDTQTGKCSKIAPLNTPSANSCATSFGKQYLFKFGGILNETEGNSLIEMYQCGHKGTHSRVTAGLQLPSRLRPTRLPWNF